MEAEALTISGTGMKKGVILITWPETSGIKSKTNLQPHLHKLP